MTQGEMDDVINSMVMNLRKLREGQAGCAAESDRPQQRLACELLVSCSCCFSH